MVATNWIFHFIEAAGSYDDDDDAEVVVIFWCWCLKILNNKTINTFSTFQEVKVFFKQHSIIKQNEKKTIKSYATFFFLLKKKMQQ